MPSLFIFALLCAALTARAAPTLSLQQTDSPVRLALQRSLDARRGSASTGAATTTICHSPTSDPQTSTVTASDWPEHQRHGDSLGACPVPTAAPSAAPTEHACAGISLPSSQEDFCMGIDGWHASIDMALSSQACNMLARTRGGTCNAWCATHGMVCTHAQDQVGNTCVLDDRHDRQTNNGNGCEQGWNNQICGCRAGTEEPSASPSQAPTQLPSAQPSQQPSAAPSLAPTAIPSESPSAQPTALPTTLDPTASPSHAPSSQPTAQPSPEPTHHPCSGSTHGCDANPGGICIVIGSSFECACGPAYECSGDCVAAQQARVCQLTASPTAVPTQSPTASPSHAPSASPTKQPSTSPSNAPSAHPTPLPSTAPSHAPSSAPSSAPSQQPSMSPTLEPTFEPTAIPPTAAPGRTARAPFTCSPVVAAPDHSCTHACAMFSLSCSATSLAACTPSITSQSSASSLLTAAGWPACSSSSLSTGSDAPTFDQAGHCELSSEPRSLGSYSCDELPDTQGSLSGKQRVCFCDAPIVAERFMRHDVENYCVMFNFSMSFDGALSQPQRDLACTALVDRLEAKHAPLSFTCDIQEQVLRASSGSRRSSSYYQLSVVGDTRSTNMAYEQLCDWSARFGVICGDQTPEMEAGMMQALQGTGLGLQGVAQGGCMKESHIEPSGLGGDGDGLQVNVAGVSVGAGVLVLVLVVGCCLCCGCWYCRRKCKVQTAEQALPPFDWSGSNTLPISKPVIITQGTVCIDVSAYKLNKEEAPPSPALHSPVMQPRRASQVERDEARLKELQYNSSRRASQVLQDATELLEIRRRSKPRRASLVDKSDAPMLEDEEVEEPTVHPNPVQIDGVIEL
eukprot:TRINITY_DN6197_c0_g1_i1.p1 TRINITY_DN6197_c0_g1~~TRINITY_DN6197_c0_g1_i1.p1  ORF type:complete len:853 (+),score=167.32 TRINITY_DN6197_c0_g1_i1:131-2689(+)